MTINPTSPPNHPHTNTTPITQEHPSTSPTPSTQDSNTPPHTYTTTHPQPVIRIQVDSAHKETVSVEVSPYPNGKRKETPYLPLPPAKSSRLEGTPAPACQPFHSAAPAPVVLTTPPSPVPSPPVTNAPEPSFDPPTSGTIIDLTHDDSPDLANTSNASPKSSRPGDQPSTRPSSSNDTPQQPSASFTQTNPHLNPSDETDPRLTSHQRHFILKTRLTRMEAKMDHLLRVQNSILENILILSPPTPTPPQQPPDYSPKLVSMNELLTKLYQSISYIEGKYQTNSDSS